MTPHLAEARRAAVHVLWAACSGATLQEASAAMMLMNELWPDGPLMLGKNSPLADSPSAAQWDRAIASAALAMHMHGEKLGVDWAERAKAEAIVDAALAGKSDEARSTPESAVEENGG